MANYCMAMRHFRCLGIDLDRELAAAECAKAIGDLSERRAQVAAKLKAAEAKWLEVAEQLEQLAA